MTTIRIGGPLAAKDVAELHGANNVKKETALSEKGEVINGYGDKPNRLSATRTVRAQPTLNIFGRGTRRIPRIVRMAAARKPTYAAPAAAGCCIALP